MELKISYIFRGVTPNVWGAGSAWGLYFLFYNSLKTWWQGGDTKTDLGPTRHMIIAAEAGLLTLMVTNPIWVVKTRLCLQYGAVPAAGSAAVAGYFRELTSYRYYDFYSIIKFLSIRCLIYRRTSKCCNCHILQRNDRCFGESLQNGRCEGSLSRVCTGDVWCFSWSYTIHDLRRDENNV